MKVIGSTACDDDSVTAMEQPQATAFALRDPLQWETFAALAREGESLGYRAVFLPEIAGRDAFAALMGLAAETRDLRLGTGIVPMTSRRARVTAMGAATVQERSGGRMILGIGTGGAGKGAIQALETQIAELRSFLGAQGGLMLRPDDEVPIWVSALGPRALALAGRLADGVILNWCTPERVAAARSDVREAAEHAGRDPDVVTIAAYIRAAVGVDGRAGAISLKRAFGEYASYPAYARQFAAMGLGAEASAAAAAHVGGRPQDISDEVVLRLGLGADEADSRARLQSYRDAGADLPVVYPALLPGDDGTSLGTTLRALAPRG